MVQLGEYANDENSGRLYDFSLARTLFRKRWKVGVRKYVGIFAERKYFIDADLDTALNLAKDWCKEQYKKQAEDDAVNRYMNITDSATYDPKKGELVWWGFEEHKPYFKP